MAKTETFMEILHFQRSCSTRGANTNRDNQNRSMTFFVNYSDTKHTQRCEIRSPPASSQIGNHLQDNNDRQKIYLKRVFIIHRVYSRGVMPLINGWDVLDVVWFTATADIFHLNSWCLGPWRTSRVARWENGLYLSDLKTRERIWRGARESSPLKGLRWVRIGREWVEGGDLWYFLAEFFTLLFSN